MNTTETDKNFMRSNGMINLYLIDNQDKSCLYRERFSIENSEGNTMFSNLWVKKGKHNFCGTRYDAWFVFEGFWWHGVNYGENNMLIFCKKTKHAYNDTTWLYQKGHI